MIADVLAALQRMGSNPPPAILVKPDDMSEAVRAATVMGSVIPELKSEIEAARRDLDDLAKTRKSIARERDELTEKGQSARGRQNAPRRAYRGAPAVSGLGAGRARLPAAARDRTRQKGDVAQGPHRPAGQRKAARKAAAAAAHAAEVAAATEIEARAQAARGADTARLKPEIAFADAKGTRAAARRGRDS